MQLPFYYDLFFVRFEADKNCRLKCNRQQPCDNCIKHNRTYMCHFTGPQGLTRKESQGIQDHLREIQNRIEQLSAINVLPQAPGLIGQNLQSLDPQDPSQLQSGSPTGPDRSELQKEFTGNMIVHQAGTRYVDPTHWQAVLNEVGNPAD